MPSQETLLVDLGSAYVSDFVKDPTETARRKQYPVQLVWNARLGCPTLSFQPPSEEMWGRYWYKSGISASMRAALQDIVQAVGHYLPFSEKKRVWLDIASNDGTLLSFVDREKFWRVGIDPIEEKYTEECRTKADVVIQDYFHKGSWERAEMAKATVVTSIAMFYDLCDPFSFARDVYEAMEEEGIWVLQLSYTPLMMEQLAFDNILGEHYAYHYLSSLEHILGSVGFSLLDVTLNEVNGGSLRVYAIKKGANRTKFGTQPLRDVGEMRVRALREYEKKYREEKKWEEFSAGIRRLKEAVTDFIVEARRQGKEVWGYGASTKGNTLLQYFGLDRSLISAIAERDPSKYGLYTVGTHIPIVSEAEMRRTVPAYALVMPWHFISEFVQRERDYLGRGGAFIVPCPKFEIFPQRGAL